jgi:hypothetical protein
MNQREMETAGRWHHIVLVDPAGFVYVDGVKIARRIIRNGEPRLQFYDRDRRRASRRGNVVEIPVEELARILGAGYNGRDGC